VDAQYLLDQCRNNSCHWQLVQLSGRQRQQGSSQCICNVLDELARLGSPSAHLPYLLALWPLHQWANYWVCPDECLGIAIQYPVESHPLLQNSSAAPHRQGWKECHRKKMVWWQASLKVVNLLNHVIGSKWWSKLSSQKISNRKSSF